MSHFLNVDQLLEAASDVELPGREIYLSFLEHATQELANALAAHLGVSVGVADFQCGFAGLAAGFGPPEDNPGMKVPYYLSFHDTGSDWMEENGAEEEPVVSEEAELAKKSEEAERLQDERRGTYPGRDDVAN